MGVRQANALVLGALAVMALCLAAVTTLRRPRTDRGWAEDFARTVTADFGADGAITLRNVRDWTYGGSAVVSRTWRDETVYPETITCAWFLIEPFEQWKAVGHTFLSFQFRDGGALSFSIEARRRAGQKYSALRGAFGAFELAYQWGTERDFVTRRLIYLHHPLRLYPLAIEPQTARALFRDLAEETNALARHPRDYNTLTENCTNALANIVNRRAPGTLAPSLSWYLSGYADAYLMKQGFIPVDGGTIERTKALHDLTPHRAAVRDIAAAPPAVFSNTLRALVQSPAQARPSF
jgi:hypothetical protein